MADFADHPSPEQLLADVRWVRALARGLAGEDGADDLAQETWLRVLARPPKALANLRPWLRTVARNLSFRSRAREGGRAAREALAARPRQEPAPDELVARARLRRSVVDAVLELDEPYRSTVLLRYFEDLRPRDIARRQSVPVATVRTRIRRGLEQLKERLGEKHGSQASWLLLLVPARDLLAASWMTGALVMGTRIKVAATAVALVLAGFGVWSWSGPAESSKGATTTDAGLAGGPAMSSSRPGAVSPIDVPSPALRPSRPKPAPPERLEEVAVTGVVIDDSTEQPVGGVAVRAMMWSGRNDDEVAGATTGPEGSFRLPLPHKGRDRGLILTSPDHAPLVVDPISHDLFEFAGNVFDVGTLRLQRGARISGRVVSLETGQPVAGAALYVAPRGYQVSWRVLSEPRPGGRSGQDGSFVLAERVPPNEGQAVILAVTASALGWAYAAVVEGRDEIGGVEIAIGRTAGVRVTVTDDAGEPVAGAKVGAVPRFPPIGPPAGWGSQSVPELLHEEIAAHFMTTSERDGSAVLPRLPLGRVDRLYQNHAASPDGYDVSAWHRDFTEKPPVRISLDRDKEVRIQLFRRRVVAIGGRVTAEDGGAIAGARVSRAGAEEGTVLTDREGTYRLAPRARQGGAETVVVRASGFATRSQEVSVAGAVDEVAADFVLAKATPISGRVVDENGRPVPGAYVDLRGGSGAGSIVLHPDGNRGLDAEGRFRFSDATAGPWTLRASDPSGEWVRPRDRVVQGGDDKVEVVFLHRPPGRARLEADVVDAVTGAAVDPAEAHVHPRQAFAGDVLGGFVRRVSAGHVTVEGIRRGEWELSVRLSNGGRASQAFTVGPDDAVIRLRVEIGKPGTLTVRVDSSRLPADASLSSVGVLMAPPDAGQWMSKPGVVAPGCTRGYAAADAANDWTVRFEDVTPNVPIRLWTKTDRGFSAEADVTVGFGEDQDVLLRLVPSANVVFRRPAGAPDAGITISFRRADGTWRQVWEASWESGGGWEWKHEVAAGHLAWKAERFPLDVDPEARRSEAVAGGELDIAAGESKEVPIVFQR